MLQSINQALQLRQLPDILKDDQGAAITDPIQWPQRRLEILDLLRREIYGYAPSGTPEVSAEQTSLKSNAFAGKAAHYSLQLQCNLDGQTFAFPVELIVPHGKERPPVFLHIAFRPLLPDIYTPVEEIIDRGYAIALFCYQDIAPDRGDDFVNGLPALFPRDPQTGWGKISMWAWAASRVLDYLLTLDTIDANRTTVIGHSRLGKTALWCAAQDERFAMAVSNNSGSSGAALHRDKIGEDIEAITQRFPYWFCGNFHQYAGREHELPFDQHYLLALIAPRPVYIGSALQDEWADPVSEFLTCAAVDPVYRMLGTIGLICDDRLPVVGDCFDEGTIAYQLRSGEHYLSRDDWHRYIAYRDKHQC